MCLFESQQHQPKVCPGLPVLDPFPKAAGTGEFTLSSMGGGREVWRWEGGIFGWKEGVMGEDQA